MTDGITEQTTRVDVAALEPAFTLLLFFPPLAEHPHWDRVPRPRQIARRAVLNPCSPARGKGGVAVHPY